MRITSSVPSPALSPTASSVASGPVEKTGPYVRPKTDLYVPYKMVERCISYVREQRPSYEGSKTVSLPIALMKEEKNPQKLARWLESAEWPLRLRFLKALEGDAFARSAFARKPEEQAAIQRYRRSISDLKAACTRVFPDADKVAKFPVKTRPFFQRALMSIRKLWLHPCPQ